ncbi:MAG: 4Fe-4S dicluster domain-containing protein [Candidatus Hodarchaeota archaeon]
MKGIDENHQKLVYRNGSVNIMALNVDEEFKKSVFETYLSDKLSYCLQCNVCTENCPVSQVNSEYDPRQLILESLMGLKSKILKAGPKALYLCTMCDTCDEKCPNDIPLTHIFSVLKNHSAKLGITADGIKGQGKTLHDFATSVPIGDAIARRRIGFGLPEKYDLPVEELQQLMEITGFSALIKKLNPEG